MWSSAPGVLIAVGFAVTSDAAIHSGAVTRNTKRRRFATLLPKREKEAVRASEGEALAISDAAGHARKDAGVRQVLRTA